MPANDAAARFRLALDIFKTRYINARTMLFRANMRFGIHVLGVSIALLLALASAAQAAELVMFRRDGCPWCAMWDREIGPIYSKTEVGRRAPLRMLDLDRGTGGIRARSPIHYTPTFVLVENGEEVGRIEGYPGNDFFFGLLQNLVQRLPGERKL
jgi:hypothetical protein